MFEGIYLCQADRVDSQEEHVQVYIGYDQRCQWVSEIAGCKVADGHIRSGFRFRLSSPVIGVKLAD